MDVNTSTNNASDAPLIYKEFDNHFIKINGTFKVTGSVNNSSSKTLKERFKTVYPQLFLYKITQLTIDVWSYKEYPKSRHIGPIAEEFSQSFRLSNNEQSISTIGVTGVALVAIEELKKVNDQIKS